MILVTGATGHIGNVLIREILERKEQVRAMVLPLDRFMEFGDQQRESAA
jgi:dihydroflavonol-4-reductase